MDHLQVFDEYRPLLFAIAYRMLGLVMEAEDVLQEAFIRWRNVPVQEVDSGRAYLSAVVTRLCIDQLRSAQARREEYIGPWLPEPLIADPSKEPYQAVALSESLSMAFPVILENLTPDERAAFLLREVFDYEYEDIARILDKSETACRQLVSRARRHVEDRRPRFEVNPQQHRAVLERFNQAVAAGDMRGLLAVLADDVESVSDGGGMRGTARRPVRGAQNVATFILNLIRLAPPGTTYHPATVNGGPGIITCVGGQPYAVLSILIVRDRIGGFRVVTNPDKLRHVPALGDLSPGQFFASGDSPLAGEA